MRSWPGGGGEFMIQTDLRAAILSVLPPPTGEPIGTTSIQAKLRQRARLTQSSKAVGKCLARMFELDLVERIVIRDKFYMWRQRVASREAPVIFRTRSEIIKATWADPEMRARHLAAMVDPEVRARCSAGATKAWTDPGVRARRLAGMSASQARRKAAVAAADQRFRGSPPGSTYLYLTTTGRVTGQPREIEIWFAEHDGRFYLVAESESANWVRNIQAQPQVKFRVTEAESNAAARLVHNDREPQLVATVKALFDEKYGWSDGLVVELTPA
jgi:deazaflavin-dependent oxidoreductase (nitroreductase family)